jgi:nucleoid-associated protein YgaU
MWGFKMKTGIAGILVLSLAVMILVLPGCTSIQDHWTVPDDQQPAAVVPAEKVPSSGSVDQDPVRETHEQEEARKQEEEARLQRETAARQEAEARENARRQEEVRRLLEELEATHTRQEAESRLFSGDQTAADPKPRYYVVQPGDTFNSIAADPRIYDSRNEWFTLYQANRNKLDNPDNPNLLVPGMVIEIPSITGEIRKGSY